MTLAMLARMKLEKGCVDCGYRGHHVALDFDHVPGNGKVKNVSQLRVASLNRLMLEVEKCEVVCANCHRIRTYNRLSVGE